MLDLASCERIKLEHLDVVPAFSCGDNELDEYLQKDAIHYENHLYASTYLFVKGNPDNPTVKEVIAFYSLSSDRVRPAHPDSKDGKRMHEVLKAKNLPINLSKLGMPAILIGRLAVAQVYQGNKIGTNIIDAIVFH